MSVDRYVCIHGHFYQPPRENPWLEKIEVQHSAHPYHDWNERIAAECYDPNRASRILDKEGMIVAIVNNYARMSFDFGPTLLSWMERHSPETYEAVLEADRMSRERFSGHGSALAQCYSHMIMPLANGRDKLTQVVWGIKDFEHRFKRSPEGMWLPELAVDIPTLEIIADQGISFIILAPRQAWKVRKQGRGSRWSTVTSGAIDPTMPNSCRLPSGRSISIFFYDAPISQDVAFGGLLGSGEELTRRIVGAFSSERKHPQLVHIATDGETFGHHHRGGDVALTFCLNDIASKKIAVITNYGEYLAKHPPTHEVAIIESSSWSCVHGVERWRDNCGCRAGSHPGWTQEWRKPLREALDEIRFSAIGIFEKGTRYLLRDPWTARNHYISIILDRSKETIRDFFCTHALHKLSPAEEMCVLKHLEMQRNAMLMYTSCGWFFDEISGIEGIQILRYASRVMELAEELTGEMLEHDFLTALEGAPSNVYANGAQAYLQLARPARVDMLGIAAHFAISSLYHDYPEKTSFYCYCMENQGRIVREAGKQMLVVGKLGIISTITLEGATIIFAVLRGGDRGIIAGVGECTGDNDFRCLCEELESSWGTHDSGGPASLIEQRFTGRLFSFSHLFSNDRREILQKMRELSSDMLYAPCREIYSSGSDLMEFFRGLKEPPLEPFAAAAGHVANLDLKRFFKEDEGSLEKLEELVRQVQKWSIMVDADVVGRAASTRMTTLMERLSANPGDSALVDRIATILRLCQSINLELDFFKAQNIFYGMGRELVQSRESKGVQGTAEQDRWLESLRAIGILLKVTI